MIKFCPTCNRPYKTNRFDKKYCSPKCNFKIKSKPYKCPNCQAETNKPYSKEFHACSKHCHQILSLSERVPINCPTCNTDFFIKKTNENKIFCSYDCRVNYKKLSEQERDAIHDIRVKAKKKLQKTHLNSLEKFIEELNN